MESWSSKLDDQPKGVDRGTVIELKAEQNQQANDTQGKDDADKSTQETEKGKVDGLRCVRHRDSPLPRYYPGFGVLLLRRPCSAS